MTFLKQEYLFSMLDKLLFCAILMDINLFGRGADMSLIHKTFTVPIAVTAAAYLVSAAFAQTAAPASTAAHGDIQRAADLVNLMRTVLDPNPAPVLASPAERAVSGKTTADPASSLAMTVPVVTMPDIEIPEEVPKESDKADSDTEKPAQPAADTSREKDADGDDSDTNPPLYYVFFYGDYVPYFRGWYYYSDRWLWGRQWPAPLEPPGWIPPLPRTRLFNPGRPVESGGTNPVVPSRHRIPRKNETRTEPPPKNDMNPVSPNAHRIPRGSR